MKFRSLKFLIVEAFKNMWVNRLMSIASIGVLAASMLLMGFMISLSANVDAAMDKMEKQNVAVVFIEDTYTREQAYEIQAKIKKLSNVSGTKFITKEDGLKRMQKEAEEYSTLFEMFSENPLPDSVEVSFENLELVEKTLGEIKKLDGVMRIRDDKDVTTIMSGFRKAINTAGFWIIALLALISLVIIANTIRITMHNRRREIGIMKAVGATSGFIRFPFVVEGIFLGIISSIIAIVMLYFLYRTVMDVVIQNLPQDLLNIQMISFRSVYLKIFGIFVGIGTISGLIGSVFSISKYLRREGSAESIA